MKLGEIVRFLSLPSIVFFHFLFYHQFWRHQREKYGSMNDLCHTVPLSPIILLLVVCNMMTTKMANGFLLLCLFQAFLNNCIFSFKKKFFLWFYTLDDAVYKCMSSFPVGSLYQNFLYCTIFPFVDLSSLCQCVNSITGSALICDNSIHSKTMNGFICNWWYTLNLYHETQSCIFLSRFHSFVCVSMLQPITCVRSQTQSSSLESRESESFPLSLTHAHIYCSDISF